MGITPNTEKARRAVRGVSRRPWRIGIRVKLFVVVIGLVAMTLLAGLLTWRSYNEVEKLLVTVTQSNLPSVAGTWKLAEAAARLEAATNTDETAEQLERLDALTDQLERLAFNPMLIWQLRGRLADVSTAAPPDRQAIERLTFTVGLMAEKAEAEASRNRNLVANFLADGRKILLVIGLGAVLGPLIFVWFYVGRNIVGRLAEVAETMQRIVAGDYKTVPPRSGNDEITDMAEQLIVFQQALARLRASTDALQASEGRLRTILDTSPLALAISRTRDHQLLYVNPRWLELFGMVMDEAIGRDASMFYADAADRERLTELALSRFYVGDYEARMRGKGDAEFWALLSAAAIDMDGEPAVIVSSADITKRKDQEAALAEAKRAAEDASQAKSLFLATMSHEIRTPMNGVLTMAQLLEEMHLPAEQHEMARVIRDSASTLLTIINDILDFSKIESGKLHLEEVEVSPTAIVEGVADLLGPRALEKGIGLVTHVDPALPETVRGDPVRLRQIITNLAGNAIKFTDRGCVRIAVAALDLTARPITLRFTVTDTGIGLDAEQQAMLFEPFIQADTTISRRYGGTGLGLSICRRLVAMMGGDIGVTSAVGEGSTFWFELPLAVASDNPEQGPDLTGLAILAVAEGPVAADSIRHYLGHLGAEVDVAASPEDAATAFKQAAQAGRGYDVVLLDGAQDVRPRMAAARVLMADCAKIILTAPQAVHASVAAEIRAAGLFATLAKPMRRAALWQVVAAAAGRGSLPPDEDPDERGGHSFAAPSVEEAAAAGALILVAEDNPTNQVVIRRLMERLGYAIDLVSNGVEAWDRMQIRDYGLLLTDCHMPEMDGYDLTMRVRAWERETLNRIPIVALTADALAGTAQRCQECGMDAFLAKPVDLAVLEETISNLLPRAVMLRRRRGAAACITPSDPVAQPVDDESAPVLDLTPLREIFGAITPDARELLDLFIETTEPLTVEIERALADDDIETAREAAHSAKGAGGSAGCYRFSRLCSEIEQACAKGDPATATALIPPMRAAFATAVDAIRAV